MGKLEPMNKSPANKSARAALPSVHSVLDLAPVRALAADHGQPLVTEAVQSVLADARLALSEEAADARTELKRDAIVQQVGDYLEGLSAHSLRPVFNLSGTVLHTNLGRAALPQEAVEAVSAVAAGASNLEYDLAAGRRGDRDDHLEAWICRLTGAEAATVVNNNAAAVLLVLNSLALRREVPVSRGELIEIGGAFRLPDIMKRAGCKLHEVGTTNRTHLADFADAMGARTAMLLKVHPSNYAIEGFSAVVPDAELAALARGHDVPYVIDLGSGSLIDLANFGLPPEPTPREAFAAGTDLVTFSGDKLLGGPQCGIIAGRADLVARIKKNPMKRALRVDKMTIAALEAVLRLYADPDRLAERLPTLRLLTREAADMRRTAEKLQPALAARLGEKLVVEVIDCESQIGSGALPVDALPSAGLAIRPVGGKRGGGAALKRLAAALRALPIPVIGRIRDGALVLDIRCLEDDAAFAAQLPNLKTG